MFDSFYEPMGCNPPGFSVHGIFQARILEWVAISFSRDLLDPGMEPASLVSLALAGGFFTIVPPGKPPVQILYPFHARSSWHLCRDTRRAKKAAVSFSHTSPQVRKSYNNDSSSGLLTFFKVRLKKKKFS